MLHHQTIQLAQLTMRMPLTPWLQTCREGLIAVNYPARASGITRHMRVHEARQKCPQLQTVHVQTIGAPRPAPLTSPQTTAALLH